MASLYVIFIIFFVIYILGLYVYYVYFCKVKQCAYNRSYCFDIE